MSTNYSEQSDKSHQYSQSQSKKSEEALATGIDHLSSFAKTHSDGANRGVAYSKDGSTSRNTAARSVMDSIDSLKSELGTSDTSSALSALTVGLGIGNSVTDSDSVSKEIGKGLRSSRLISLGAKGGVDAKGQQIESNQAVAAVSKARSEMYSMGITTNQDLVNTMRNSDEFKQMRSSNSEGAARVQASFSESERYASSAEASLQESLRYQQIAQAAKSFGANFTANMGVAWNDFLRAKDPELPNDASRVKEQLSYLPEFLESQGVLDDGGRVKNMIPQSEHNPVGGNITELAPGKFKPIGQLEKHLETLAPDGRESVITRGHENQGEVRALQNEAGVTPEREVKDPGLKRDYDNARDDAGHIQNDYSVQATAAQTELQKKVDDGITHQSPMNALGYQPDGRSGYQQLKRSQQEQQKELSLRDQAEVDAGRAADTAPPENTSQTGSQKKNEIPESTPGMNLPVGTFSSREVPHGFGSNGGQHPPLPANQPAAGSQLPEAKLHVNSPPRFVGPGATQYHEEKPGIPSSIAPQGSLFSVAEAKPTPPAFSMQSAIPDAENLKEQRVDLVPPIAQGLTFAEDSQAPIAQPEQRSSDTVVSLAAPQAPPADSPPSTGLSFQAVGPRVSGPDVPVDGIVALKYGDLRPGDNQLKMKQAFIAAPEGDPVRSTMDGKVVVATSMRGFGNLVMVQDRHDKGRLLPFFGNLGEINVKEGDVVRKGDVIGTVGGRYEDGPSGVVFGKTIEGVPVDPLRNVPGLQPPRVRRTAPRKKR